MTLQKYSSSEARLGKVESAYEPSGQEYFYSPLDAMLVHRRVTLGIKFVGTHFYSWMERDIVRVKVIPLK